MSPIIKLYWLNLTSFLTETGFLSKIYFTNIMLNLLIIKAEMVHDKDESLSFVDLISLKNNGCVFVDGEYILFSHFKSDYSKA